MAKKSCQRITHVAWVVMSGPPRRGLQNVTLGNQALHAPRALGVRCRPISWTGLAKTLSTPLWAGKREALSVHRLRALESVDWPGDQPGSAKRLFRVCTDSAREAGLAADAPKGFDGGS